MLNTTYQKKYEFLKYPWKFVVFTQLPTNGEFPKSTNLYPLCEKSYFGQNDGPDTNQPEKHTNFTRGYRNSYLAHNTHKVHSPTIIMDDRPSKAPKHNVHRQQCCFHFHFPTQSETWTIHCTCWVLKTTLLLKCYHAKPKPAKKTHTGAC